MPLTSWLSVAGILLLGAMSPGPSLAVVMHCTIQRGRRGGLQAAWGHGLGVGLYALVTVIGGAMVIARSPVLFITIQYVGALVLVVMGGRALWTRPTLPGATLPGATLPGAGTAPSPRGAFVAGLAIAGLNPKMAVFFFALFSQFVHLDASTLERSILIGTAGCLDACWFSFVAWGLSGQRAMRWLRAHHVTVTRIFGALLVAVAVSLVVRSL